ncbi:MAG TPA: hypothetical protein DIT10_02265 [Chryseobacterium sp.]|nr:hypothetical protein [Chryseobacterium sp.]
MILMNIPIAYATEIKQSIEQSKSAAYYQETVDEQQAAAIPEKSVNTENQAQQPRDAEAKEATKPAPKQEVEPPTRLPELSEAKVNQEEQALIAQYGQPILVDGQEQIFKKDDRNYITYVSSDRKTYQAEDGNAYLIDLTLVSEQADGKTIFKPRGSPVSVSLPEKVDQTQGIKVSKGKNTLELIPKDKQFDHATVKDNAVLYNNVDASQDVQYTVTDNGVKEEIILDKWRDKHEFAYEFSSEKYRARLENNQVLVTKKGEKAVLFVLSAPVMVDKAGETSTAIKMHLTQGKKAYTLTIDADKTWLTDEKRVYPVRIDPTVVVPTQNLIDTVTSSVHGTYQGRGYGYVGYITQAMTGVWNAKDVGRTRLYTKVNYDFSKIPKEAKINSASYNLYQYIQYPQTNATFSSYKLTQDFNIKGLTWDNSVGLTQEPTGEKAISKAKYGMHRFDIRDTVNSWVQGLSPNYGLVVQATNENDYGGAFYTTDSTGSTGQADFTPDKRPSLTINWSVPDPVDATYPLGKTTVNLRSMISSNKNGKLQFQGVFADGITTPGAIVDYQLSDPAKAYSGQSYASFSYKFPDSSLFNQAFEKGTTKYKDKLANWQTGLPFTNPDLNKVYTIDAESKKGEASSGKKQSEKFVIYKVTQYDTLPKIAAYYGVPLSQIVFDNRVQDMLLVANNTLFIRNPKQNAEKPYNPPKLSDSSKEAIDSLLMGRGLHCEFGFEPVNLNTGNFYLNRTDVTIPSFTQDFDITRHYNSKGASQNSLFGRGWSFAFNEQVTRDEAGNLYYTRTDGSILRFAKNGDTYTAPAGYDLSLSVREKEKKKADFGNGEESYSVVDYLITDKSGQEKTFNFFGMITSQKDDKGNLTKLDYNENGQLTAITDPTGLIYRISVNDVGYISRIGLPNGASLSYDYDAAGHLMRYIDASDAVTRYDYNQEDLMTAWYDGKGSKIIDNTYDDKGRVIQQVDGIGAVSKLAYGEGKTTTTDANGNVTRYHYDDQYRTTKIDYPDQTSLAKSYDQDNRLVSETNELGQKTRITYDAAGNVLTQTRVDGAVETNTYDDKHHLLSEVDFDGKKTVYTYDAVGNLKQVIKHDGAKTSFKTTKQGLITSTTDALGQVTTYSYTGAFLTKITSPLKGVTSMRYNAHGLPVTITNPLGGVTTITYDQEGRKTSEIDPDGRKTSYVFDGAGQVTSSMDGNGFTSKFTYDAVGNTTAMENGAGGVYRYTYDGVGNKLVMVDPEGHETRYAYDQRSRLTRETDTEKNQTSHLRDALGRVLKMTNAAGNATSYTYAEGINQIASETDALGQVTTNTYDRSGNITRIVKPDGSTISNVYDDANRLIKTTDGLGVVSSYTYDLNGNKLSETIDKQTTTYAYNGLGKVTAITYPNKEKVAYTYDLAGDVLSFTDARGKQTSYAYSKSGALKTITDAKGQQTKVTYDDNGNQSGLLDAAGFGAKTRYNAHNLPETVVDALGNQTTYAYSQLEQVTSTIDALGNQKSYTYNALGYPVAVKDENGNVSKLSYTPTGQTQSVENPDGTSVQYRYDALDRLISEEKSNGLITTYDYDSNDRVIQLTDNQGMNESYTYNAHGQRLTQTNSLGETTTYAYDLKDHLIKMTYADKTTESFTYDAMGNLLTSTDVLENTTTYRYDQNGNLKEKKDAKGRVTSYRYDALNQVVTETNPAGGKITYTYDVLGNVSSITDENGEKTSYGYDANKNLILYTDAKGSQTALKYDPLSRLSEKVSPTGAVERFTYDKLGNKTSDISAEGNQTSYTYDSMNRLASITKPTGGVQQFTYDATGAVLSETDENQHQTKYENDLYGQTKSRILANGARYSYAYDKLGRLSKQTAPKGLSQSYHYDVSGNLIKQVDQSKRETRYTYDKSGHVLTTTNPANLTTKFSYDDSGNLTQATTPNGLKTSYNYDVMDRLKAVTQPTGRQTTYDYDPVGQLTTRTINGDRKETYHYDPNGNLTQTINAKGQKRTKNYDDSNRLITETDTAGRRTAYRYDKDDRLTRIMASTGTTSDLSYDENGNLTQVASGGKRLNTYRYDKADQLIEAKVGLDKEASKTSYAYDAVGNVTEITNGNGKKTTYRYDELSNVVEKVNSLGDKTAYTYDAENRLKKVKQANQKTITYDYNTLDQLLKVDYSEKSDGQVLYTYDADGRRVSMNDLTGQTDYAYNDAGDITGLRQGDGSLIQYAYDKYGNIKQLTYPDGSQVAYRYDELDRLIEVIDKDKQKTRYTYDDAGNMTAVKRADGSRSYMRYRLDNRIEQITHLDKKGKTISAYDYDYDADNQISEERITQDGETLVQKYVYDSLGQLTQMTIYDQTKKHEKADYQYTYDQAGNKLTSTARVGDQKTVTNMTYDANNRLVSQSNAGKTTTFSYDQNGNRIKKSGEDSELTYVYDTENRLLAVKDKAGLLQAALYDGDSNRVFTASQATGKTTYQLFSEKAQKQSPKTSTKGQGNSLFWYGFTENVIQGFSSLSETMGNFWIDTFDTLSQAYHQKIAKDRANKEGIVVNPPELGNRPGEGDVTYASQVKDVLIPYTTREDSYQYYETRNYVNDINQAHTQVLQTYDEALNPRERYTYGNERLSYENSQTKQTYQYLSDARGSVTGMTKDGKAESSMNYDAFGKPDTKDKTGNPYGYTGEAQDVTGLSYLRARYYDSQSATFLSQDSYEGEQDTPLSQNGYSYVENNPINYTDPTGHKKNIFQKAWGWTKKNASKAWNTTKRVANNLWSGTKKVVSNVVNWVGNQISAVSRTAGNVWNGIQKTASTVWNSARTYAANQSQYYASGGYAQLSYIRAIRQQAIRSAQRQQRISLEYSQLTGNKGKPKTKEGKNIFKNWGASLKETIRKFCTTAKKPKKQVIKKIESVNLPTTKGEITRDYHWSTNYNMYVNNKTGSPSQEVTLLYNTIIAEESAPKKDSRLEFYNEMIRTGKHPSTGKKLSKAEKTNAQLMIYSLVLQPFVGAYSASKFNQQKNVAGNGGKSSGGADFSKPKHFLDDALKQQGLNKVPEKLKQKWTYGEYNYEVRVHPGDSKYTEAKTIYRASRKLKPIQGKQGSGIEYMDKNGKWWHQSELREFNGDGTLNPLFNKDAAKNTHIPMD